MKQISDGSLICIAAHYDDGVTDYGYENDAMRKLFPIPVF